MRFKACEDDEIGGYFGRFDKYDSLGTLYSAVRNLAVSTLKV